MVVAPLGVAFVAPFITVLRLVLLVVVELLIPVFVVCTPLRVVVPVVPPEVVFVAPLVVAGLFNDAPFCVILK